MAKVHEQITEDLATFIAEQPLFFVATAPLTGEGHINLSPKGLDCLRVLSPRRVAYLDLTGSGNETSAHLAENGRITLMFCAFKGAPSILRLYGRGYVVLPGTVEWDELHTHFNTYPGERQIIVTDVERVQTSCGFGVPLMDYVDHRDTLLRWAETRGDEAMRAYHQEENMVSIDGLPTPLAERLVKENRS